VRGKGPLSERQLKQARRWVAADWESHDIDRDAVKLITRLLQTVSDRDANAQLTRDILNPPQDYRPTSVRIEEALRAKPMRTSEIHALLGVENTTVIRHSVDDMIYDLVQNGKVRIDSASYLIWVGESVPPMKKIPGRYCQASDHKPGEEPDAVKRVCYDSNPYENDKYMYVCEAHLGLEEK